MSLHRLTRVVMGVPNVTETAAYYEEFGLDPLGDNSFGTRDGGEQLIDVVVGRLERRRGRTTRKGRGRTARKIRVAGGNCGRTGHVQ